MGARSNVSSSPFRGGTGKKRKLFRGRAPNRWEEESELKLREKEEAVAEPEEDEDNVTFNRLGPLSFIQRDSRSSEVRGRRSCFGTPERN